MILSRCQKVGSEKVKKKKKPAQACSLMRSRAHKPSGPLRRSFTQVRIKSQQLAASPRSWRLNLNGRGNSQWADEATEAGDT